MARASYQHIRNISFGERSKPAKHILRLPLKPIIEPVAPITIAKPIGRTILKIRTPLN